MAIATRPIPRPVHLNLACLRRHRCCCACLLACLPVMSSCVIVGTGAAAAAAPCPEFAAIPKSEHFNTISRDEMDQKWAVFGMSLEMFKSRHGGQHDDNKMHTAFHDHDTDGNKKLFKSEYEAALVSYLFGDCHVYMFTALHCVCRLRELPVCLPCMRPLLWPCWRPRSLSGARSLCHCCPETTGRVMSGWFREAVTQ
jgi:hypothetical protein